MTVEVDYYDTPYGMEAQCRKCGSSVYWEDCWNCEGGFSYHDCGEDTCCCLDKSPNVVCDTCDGAGGWWVCLGCKGEDKK
jgi:hypothetical protein